MIQTFFRFTISLCTMLAGLCLEVVCQTTSNTTAGALISLTQNGNQINIQAEHAFIQLTVYSANTIRMRYTISQNTSDFSYAVTASPKETNIHLTENDSAYLLSTDSLTLSIGRQPLLFSFYNLRNELINQDDFGAVFTGTEITTYKRIMAGERFIGLGEKTGNLDRRGNGYTNWNTDCYGYTPDTDPMYVSIPFYIGIHDSLCYGIYLDNSSKSHFNFGASNTRFSSFSVEEGEMDYYFIYHTTVAGIITSYTGLTGRMEMPPIWSLGFQQCRWSYFPDTEVLHIAKTFREKNIPLDVIYLDIDYMDHYKIFTWDDQKFTDPGGMLTELKSMGIHTTVIVDPGIKIEKGYPSYQEGIKNDLFVKYPDGTFYTGEVWPGLCHFPDFTKQETRSWWGNSFETYVKNGVDGFWNDMNEPATWGQKFPSLVEFNFDGNGGTTLEARNIYGMQMARATFEGTKKLMINQRPFVLTRAGFAGIQRYSAVWTGDNTPSDDHLLLGVRLVNSLGISGVSFAGVDVGGFNADATSALYARWITVGAFTPFFRAHKMINQKESEPWSYGEQTEEIARKYISLRYQLLPYLYSSFYESSTSGIPVARTLAIDYPFDDEIYKTAFQNEYLFGEAILVAPLKSTESITKVYLPAGQWFDFYTNNYFEGNKIVTIDAPLTRLPLFVKAGSIIPMQSITQSTSEKPSDTLIIHLYIGTDNSFNYYEDDGMTYNYTSGNFYRRTLNYSSSANQLTFSKPEGAYSSQFKYIKIYFHSDQKLQANVRVDDVGTSFTNESVSMMGGFPLNYATSENMNLSSLVIDNAYREIQINW